MERQHRVGVERDTGTFLTRESRGGRSQENRELKPGLWIKLRIDSQADRVKGREVEGSSVRPGRVRRGS